MGIPLNLEGRMYLAHTIVQSMIFEEGIFIGREGGDPEGKWEPGEDDVALLWNLLRTTPGLDKEIMRVYSSQFRISRYFAINEEKFKASPWYRPPDWRKEGGLRCLRNL